MTIDQAAISAIPIACQLTERDQQTRSAEVTAIFAQVTAIEELPTGYAFGFPDNPQTALVLLEFIRFERACCPFFTFTLRSSPPHTSLWLELFGGDEVKEMIAGTFIPQAVSG